MTRSVEHHEARRGGYTVGTVGTVRTGETGETVETRDPQRSAVEVIALFDGAILEARHFIDPAGGRLRRGTVAQLAGGGTAVALSLAMLVLAFARGGGAALDVASAVLVGGGLLLVARGLGALEEDRRPRDFTIGCGRGALLPLEHPAVSLPAFPLVRSTGTGFELVVTEGFRGELTALGRTLPLAEAARFAAPSDAAPGARAIPILDGTRARIELGATTLHVRRVPAPRRQPVPLRLDLVEHRYTGGIAAAAILFVGLVFAIPPDASALSLGEHDRDLRIARFLIAPPVELLVKPPVDTGKKDESPTASRSGKRHAGPSGVMGKKDTPNVKKRFSIAGHTPDLQLARAVAIETARSAGVLGTLTANTPMMRSLFSTNVSALGEDAEHVMGNLIGTQVGTSGGTDGMALVGGNHGGGGDGVDTIGVGPLGRIGGGNCPGCPGGGGPGMGTGRLHDRKVREVEVSVVKMSQPDTTEGLDREIIKRVIRKHMNEVKFCYDLALQRKPDLTGKVVVHFAIGPLGAVAAAGIAESSMTPEVGQCVSLAVRRWEFPRPTNGRLVMVNYPFAFRSAPAAQ